MEHAFGEVCLPYFKHYYQDQTNLGFTVVTSALTVEGIKQV